MYNSAARNSTIIKEIANELGFDFCGISKAEQLDEDAINLEKWLNKGYHGKMKWMENHFEKRVDPTKLVEDSKSVISLLLNYSQAENFDQENIKIAKYAYGMDYHFVIKDKLKIFLALIN